MGHDLDLEGHVTSSFTWPFACPWAISSRCSISTDTLSPRDFWDIEAQIYLGHGLDLFRSRDVICHVTILSAVCGFLTCSIDTNPLFWAVREILSLKHIWVVTLTFRVTWRHRSRDRTVTDIFDCKGPGKHAWWLRSTLCCGRVRYNEWPESPLSQVTNWVFARPAHALNPILTIFVI